MCIRDRNTRGTLSTLSGSCLVKLSVERNERVFVQLARKGREGRLLIKLTIKRSEFHYLLSNELFAIRRLIHRLTTRCTNLFAARRKTGGSRRTLPHLCQSGV